MCGIVENKIVLFLPHVVEHENEQTDKEKWKKDKMNTSGSALQK
jgi:hypothetical protein